MKKERRKESGVKRMLTTEGFEKEIKRKRKRKVKREEGKKRKKKGKRSKNKADY